MVIRVFNPEGESEKNSNHHRQLAGTRTRKRFQRQAAGGEIAAQKPVRRLTMVDILPLAGSVRTQRTNRTGSADIDDSMVDRIADRIASKMGVNLGGDTRTNGPGVKPAEPISLGDVLKSCFERFSSNRGEGSWSGYRTLVKYWERHWNGSGPDLNSLTTDQIQEFFESVGEWQSQRSWQKNSDLLYKLLKTACPMTISNKEGRRKDAPLSLESLPVWELPRERWFRDRKTAAVSAETEEIGGLTPSRSPEGKRDRSECGHRRRNLPLMTVTEFGRILTACKSATYLDPVWWECFLCQIWFKGDRWADMWRYRWDDMNSLLRVDLKKAAFLFTETKKGGESSVPIPSWLYGRLSLLRSRQPQGTDRVYVAAPNADSQFAISSGDTSNRERHWKPQYQAIFDAAGVELRKPHELRGVAISHWFKHAPKYRFAATGHSPPASDVQLRNYITLDEDFRAAAESFPFPAEHRLS